MYIFRQFICSFIVCVQDGESNANFWNWHGMDIINAMRPLETAELQINYHVLHMCTVYTMCECRTISSIFDVRMCVRARFAKIINSTFRVHKNSDMMIVRYAIVCTFF